MMSEVVILSVAKNLKKFYEILHSLLSLRMTKEGS
jgi:hypothetical protein